MEREKTNQPQMRNFPVLNQNYENGLCKSCPFIQSSSVDVKIICVHVCAHVYTCLHPKDTLYHIQETQQRTKDKQQKKRVRFYAIFRAICSPGKTKISCKTSLTVLSLLLCEVKTGMHLRI